jgi:hypothetical protein
MKRGTRPRKNRIEVWCDNDELARIKANAESTRLSNSEFLRNLGKGYKPKSAFDKAAISACQKTKTAVRWSKMSVSTVNSCPREA